MRAPENLLADCGSCFGLCCVALPFAKSSDFAVDKAAGEPCRNLLGDSRCGIHSTLREKGFPGCAVYDCFGAGQKVSQSSFAGRDWRQQPSNSSEMFAVFPIMRDLHELLWYLADVRDRDSTSPLHNRIGHEYDELEALTESAPEVLLSVDVSGLRSRINELLIEASDLVRTEVKGKKKNYRGRDLIGAQLAGADLRGPARSEPARYVSHRGRPAQGGPASGRHDRRGSPGCRPPRHGHARQHLCHAVPDRHGTW